MKLLQILASVYNRSHSVFPRSSLRRQTLRRSQSGTMAISLIEQLESRPMLTLAPGTLLIYYGYPSDINSSNGDVNTAATEFAKYRYVVLGDTLEHTNHADHTNTNAIVTSATTDNTTFFGYVDLGVSTQGLSKADIHTDIDEWKLTGVNGIFLDDFGYDFGTSRDRQNDAVDYAHSVGLPVVANGFHIDQVFSSAQDGTYNSMSLPTHLTATDFYLYEDYQITSDLVNYPTGYIAGATWRSKADELATVRATLPIQVLTVTVTDNPTFDSNQFNYAWYSTALDGYAAFGWGEPDFSASSSSAPFHTRPSVNLGNVFNSGVNDTSSVVTRDTDTGRISIDTTAHTQSFGATVNHAPAGTSKTVTAVENTPDALKSANFGFTDPNDSPANTLLAVKFTLLPSAGVLKDNGVPVTVNQIVTVTDINGGKLVFTPNSNLVGGPFFVCKFQVEDNGGTASGGVNLDPSPKVLYVTLLKVNHAPVGTTGTVTTAKNTAYKLKTADFGFTDPNDSPPNTLLAVKFTLLPSAGTLKDNGVTVTANQLVTAAEINAGKLVFTPNTNLTGGPLFLCKFQVEDNGGTANGGVNLDSTPKVLYVKIK